MKKLEDTIVVFTARSPERIIHEGGSQAWVLNPTRARQCTWLVCTQNQHNENHEFSDATEPHGTAFLIGRISSIRKAPEDGADSDRWQVAISDFARINLPDAWDHGRNPVRYTSLSGLGISPETIEFQTMPTGTQPVITNRPPLGGESSPGLTIAEAKKALAATFGIRPDAIEITIRG